MKMVVVHFNPLDKYPPAVNLLRYLGTQQDDPIDIHVITTHIKPSSWIKQIKGIRGISIRWKENKSKLARFFTYIIFNLKALLYLARTRPNLVMYYETLSSWAPVFYKRFIDKNVRLFIHYHEYNTVEEYNSGMLLNRYFHRNEKKIYHLAEWISHTNNDRMELFKRDLLHKTHSNTYTLSNYPPLTWWDTSRLVERTDDKRIGFVYVGALSLDTMHIREMANFVAANAEFCYWDIFSDNHSPEALSFLNNLYAENICFKGAVTYDELPGVLPKYDIGLILYKGNTPNFAFNAPNKYFEYLACGINVVYGAGMKGMHVYEQPFVKPWTRCVDFASLEKSHFDDAKKTRAISVQVYFAEKVYAPFRTKILNNQASD